MEIALGWLTRVPGAVIFLLSTGLVIGALAWISTEKNSPKTWTLGLVRSRSSGVKADRSTREWGRADPGGPRRGRWAGGTGGGS